MGGYVMSAELVCGNKRGSVFYVDKIFMKFIK